MTPPTKINGARATCFRNFLNALLFAGSLPDFIGGDLLLNPNLNRD
jgi:hypothetical protein